MCRILLSCFIIFFSITTTAQSVAINTDGSIANSSALLDVKSTDKGMLVPRMNKTQKNTIINPATGLLVFQNNPDSIGFHYYDGAKWIWLAGTTNTDTLAWKTSGNTGTSIANHFFGTTDNVPLSFRQNNNWIGRLNSATNNYTLGFNAGRNTIGTQVIAIGDSAQANGNASQSVVIGSRAAKNNNSGGSIVIGYEAAYNNTTPGVAIGYQSQRGQGSELNTSIGTFTLYEGSTGAANTAIGYGSMIANKSGSLNTAIGSATLRSNISGSFNTAVGTNALFYDTFSLANTAIGFNSLVNSKNSFANTAVGYSSLYTDSTGSANVAIGHHAAFFNKTGNNNIAIGKDALLNSTNRSNLVAIGTNALKDNSISATIPGSEAINNTGIGHEVLAFNRRGSNNVAIGTQTLAVDTFSRSNTAVGALAMQASKNSSFNTAIGANALFSNIDGTNNVAVGANSMLLHKSQGSNTAIGVSALANDTTGISNTAIGTSALRLNASGAFNTAVGLSALGGSPNGSNNTALGFLADAAVGVQNATAIGSNSYVAQSNSMILGSINGINFATADTKVGIGTTAPHSTLHANGTVAIGVGISITGGSIGSPSLLTTTKAYLGLSPAVGADHYVLPDPATCTGRIYYIRNNDNFISSFVGTSAGLLCPGSSNCLAAGTFYELKNSTSVKTIIAISDGISWIIGKID